MEYRSYVSYFERDNLASVLGKGKNKFQNCCPKTACHICLQVITSPPARTEKPTGMGEVEMITKGGGGEGGNAPWGYFGAGNALPPSPISP
ncbi:hypothetical protein AFLA_000488 [Aspergillus flavus NRRL3357]|nr:hypothetical protein AFLA_000488 [Aspergillus flavus NRRL3357]